MPAHFDFESVKQRLNQISYPISKDDGIKDAHQVGTDTQSISTLEGSFSPTLPYQAIQVASEPLTYFLQANNEGPYLRVSDIVLRANLDPKEIFSRLIRFATNSHWSHSALVYLLSDPHQGFDNTFLVEAMTSGIRVASWHNEVTPFERFTVGIRRVPLDWYVETPQEAAHHRENDPEDVHGIAYLRHVRGIAVDQINNLYSQNVINELTALYVQRFARKHHRHEVAKLAENIATWFEHRDNNGKPDAAIMRFICSGLVQYSFFAALRTRIKNALEHLTSRDAAMSNLSNMQRIIFHDDPAGIIPEYVQDVQTGKIKMSDPIPERLAHFLKTTTPADINKSTNLAWRYIIRKGVAWQINAAPPDYVPQSQDEADVLTLLS